MICQLRYCRGTLDISTDGLGRVVTRCPRCDRRRSGICRDCPASVEGAIGKALRCHEHKIKTRREQTAKFDRDNREARNRAESRRWRANKARRERKRAASREWRKKNPARVKLYKRRAALKRLPSYVASYQRWNKDPIRAEKKRKQAIAKYYELHPVRPDPRCSGCGCKIEWNGRARPRQTCDRCCNPAELRRRRNRPSRAKSEIVTANYDTPAVEVAA